MTRNGFFDSIIKEATSPRESIIKILEARGFLIEGSESTYLLSDNSCKWDGGFLNDVLVNGDIGRLEDNEILIEQPGKADYLIDTLFSNNENWTGCESFCYTGSQWKLFKRRMHGEKVPVYFLEPFVAR